MAPTNILRNTRRAAPAGEAMRRPGHGKREILIRSSGVIIRARLLDTPTAGRVWLALPIYSTAETWRGAVAFETHVETGLEPAARALVVPGEIALRADDDRIWIAWSPTPISRAGEIRLPAPSNIWARALDDVAALAIVRPGEQIAVLVAES